MITYNLTVEQVNLIIKALLKLPAEESMQLILDLQSEGQRQFEEQNKADLNQVK